ncbi:calcium-binding protein [Streptomyces prunicolor]|uniref:calcium-binding protein n=1 Tax=Streptomyces prunicolor TaxID=67348 RepID=UPI00386CE290|nr:calcium-binding protein [Streptomyces prunicolor]
MRIRATVVAVSGALALSALAVPAAQADGSLGDTKITKVVVDGDNKVTVAASSSKSIKVSVTATDNSGIASADEFELEGPGYGYLTTSKPTCVKVNATTSTCSASVLVDPRVGDLFNDNAGTWYVEAWIDAKDGDFIWKQKAGSFNFQRASQLSANAAPEPVKKGKTITVTGKLSRANWETNKNAGYSTQPVKLQFRKKNSSTYTTVKTIKTSSTGALKTTVKATADGYFRYSFAGTSTTPAVNAAGDFVDVK